MGAGSSVHPAELLVSGFLEACRRSRRQGARFLWQRGAEKLRRSAGDVDHLEWLLANELFAPLIECERLETGALEQIEDSARQLVVAHGGTGVPARFLVSLRRSSRGESAGEWTITGLERDR